MNKEAIHALLGDRPIAYHPILAKAIGSVKAAVFLGQLLYWQGKGRWGNWTYKTADEFYEETGLSRREQETARKLLKGKEILEERLAGIPAKLHFKVNMEKLIKILSLAESAKLDSPEVPNKVCGNGETISETTHEITTPAGAVEKSDPTIAEIIEQTESHPDMFDLASRTEEAQQKEGQWTVPASQGGNGLVAAAITCIYEELGSAPPEPGSGTWIKLCQMIEPVLADYHVKNEAAIRQGIMLFHKEQPTTFDPWYKSFPGQLGIYLGKFSNGGQPKVLKVGY